MTELLDRRLAAFDRGAGLDQAVSTRWPGPLELMTAVDRRMRRTRPLELVSTAIAEELTRPDGRLMVFLPPQSGKTSVGTIGGVLWDLTRDQSHRVVLASYSHMLARRMSRMARNMIAMNAVGGAVDLGLRLAPDQKAANEWELTRGGGLYATGVGGSLTGRPADCITGDTEIICEYGRITAAEAFDRGIRWILSYDHATDRAVWCRVDGARRIRGRRVVEVTTEGGRSLTCTPDHRVHTGRGYVPAGDLRVGETLVAVVACDRVPVREPEGAPEARDQEGDTPRAVPLLLARVHSGRHLRAATDAVLCVRSAYPAEPAEDLLRCVPGPQAGRGGSATRLPAVRDHIPATTHGIGLLHAGLRERGALRADDRGRELELQGRNLLRGLVPGDETAHHRAGRAPVLGLLGLPDGDDVHAGRGVGEAVWPPRAPHRRGQDEQRPGEPDHSVRVLPHHAPQVARDTVAVVRGRGDTAHDVYDFQVEGARNFFAGDLLVHNCAFIDDPLKGRAEADSPVVREALWEWWESVLSSRLAPGASVVLTLTRWHWSDLAGQLLREQPGVWRVLHIPAQADPEIVDPDPLGRAPGEFMEDARGRTREQWEKRKRDAGDEWVPLHQGAPQAPSGTLFNVDRLRYWHPSRDGSELICGPRTWKVRGDTWRFATVDLAFSEKRSADFTVACVWAIPIDGSLVLLDVARAQIPAHRQIDLARPLMERWAVRRLYVEASMRSSQLVREAVMEGWEVDDLIADADKVRRAAPAAKRVEAGRVWFPAEHEWLEAFRDELRIFPQGRHDDMVDNVSYATRILFQDFVPPQDSDPAPPPGPVGIPTEIASATDVPPAWSPETAVW